MTEDQYIERRIKGYKTGCCDVKHYRKGRADLRCTKCDSDVTLEVSFLVDIWIREFKDKQSLKTNKV